MRMCGFVKPEKLATTATIRTSVIRTSAIGNQKSSFIVKVLLSFAFITFGLNTVGYT